MPIRTAVLGYGLAGRVFHAPFISAVPGLELTGIMQRTGDSASAAWPHARIFRSPDEVFADPGIDLVVVGTPDETHFRFALQALQAGKHVVIDKPVATNSHDVQILIDEAAKQSRLVCPFQNRRWDGDFLTVSELLRTKRLGRVVEINSRFDRFRPVPKPNTWKESGGNNGGLLFDLGSHLVDQALALFGAPDRITAQVLRQRDTTAIDDAFTLTLDYDFAPLTGGPLRYLCASTMIAASPSPRFLVHGTGGSYIKFGVDPQEPAVIAGTLPPSMGQEWLPEERHAWGNLTLAPDPADPARLLREDLRTETGDYRRFYSNVRDAISLNQPLAVTAADAFRTIRLLELAGQSSKERRTLDVAL